MKIHKIECDICSKTAKEENAWGFDLLRGKDWMPRREEYDLCPDCGHKLGKLLVRFINKHRK